MEPRSDQIAAVIDHALLHPTLTERELEHGCVEAVGFKVAGVCIVPHYLKRCAEILKGTGVKIGTTIGFPHGGQSTKVKLAEVDRALADGAEELDMVVNISRVLSGNWSYVSGEIRAIVETVHAGRARLKVIFETCYLSEEQKVRLCSVCGDLGVDWVKTSTGFGPSGATAADVRLLRRHSPPQVQIKAAGGIHT
ncbi:MAG: deoxyribose-phosphate aldolase, partial [Kiritimatiellae bacterium]|nr:deoxyribose-phosphate aldolase [Kiritimatiellia bacterium]